VEAREKLPACPVIMSGSRGLTSSLLSKKCQFLGRPEVSCFTGELLCHPDSNLLDGTSISELGSVLDLARKTGSNISPTPPLNITRRGKKCKIWPQFSISETRYTPISFPKFVLFGPRKSENDSV